MFHINNKLVTFETMGNHEKYMQRCLEIAYNGLGNVAPNPMVGCVIVHDGRIIGESYHKQFGEAHAEVNAINATGDKSLLKDVTIYISLEPCAHFGKTPPCVDLIVEHKIPNVIIACQDPFAEVAGRGIKRLQDAGCNVITGVLEKEAQELNKRFFTFQVKKRPYIILKWAQTLDRFIDRKRERVDGNGINWISNDLSKRLVHKWRSEEQAILIGTNTALNDDPKLNVREWKGKDPLRIVLDRELKLPLNLNLFDQTIQTLVFTEKERDSKENLQYIPINFKANIIASILNQLYQRKIQSVIVEGGATLLNAFIASGLWDEARVFIGNKTFGHGLEAPVINLSPYSIDDVSNDKLLTYRNY